MTKLGQPFRYILRTSLRDVPWKSLVGSLKNSLWGSLGGSLVSSSVASLRISLWYLLRELDD